MICPSLAIRVGQEQLYIQIQSFSTATRRLSRQEDMLQVYAAQTLLAKLYHHSSSSIWVPRLNQTSKHGLHDGGFDGQIPVAKHVESEEAENDQVKKLLATKGSFSASALWNVVAHGLEMRASP